MTKHHRFILVALALATIGAATQWHSSQARAAGAKPESGLLLKHFDRDVRPQDDFFRFVNGAWLANTSIPADRSNFGMFTALEDQAQNALRAIVEAAAQADAPEGSDARKVGDFYSSFMDESTVETRGLSPLNAELARIDGIRTPRDLSLAIGRLQRIGVARPFAFYADIDVKQSSVYVGYLYQNGVSMPDRDYYLSDDPELAKSRAAHRIYVRDLLAAGGIADAAAVDRVIGIESRLASAHWTQVQNRDAQKTYTKFPIAEAQREMRGIDWRAFFTGAAAPRVDVIVINQPSYIKNVSAALNEIPLAHWRDYLRFSLLDSYAPLLNRRVADLHFEFHERTLSGIAEQRPRWKRGIDTIDSTIGELAGKLYVEKHFSPVAKERVTALVANLQHAFAQGLDDLDWMTPATKEQAHVKLAKFTAKLGYPNKWRDWSKLQVARDDLVGNVLRARQLTHDRLVGRIGQPVDRDEWRMTPQTVNAYYDPAANEIVFPAAILQPPFFNVNADDAVNYGAIGAVIGHEISHGFDDQGRHYDGDGNLSNWWSEEDDREFRVRAAQLTKQFGEYQPLPDSRLNGELTLGENIADLAGVTIAYRAYVLSLQEKKPPAIEGFTGEQRFFIGWAQIWARKYRDDELRKRLLIDTHSPSEYRVNGVVTNMPAYQQAFKLKPKDKLHREPNELVRIW